MKLSRRSFLFGSAAALGVVALAPYLEQITWPDSSPKLRKVYKLGIRSPEKDPDPYGLIGVSLKRWPTNEVIYHVALNVTANYIWLSQPGCEPIFTDHSLMLIDATGCPSQITIEGQDDGVWFKERYNFPGPHKERWLMGSDGSGPWLA